MAAYLGVPKKILRKRRLPGSGEARPMKKKWALHTAT